MPIYEYICQECGNDFERLQSFSDAPLEECPECRGRVRRVISPAGVIFKGSGWYITDSRRQIAGKAGPKNGKKDGEGTTKGSEGAGAGDSGAAGDAPGTPGEKGTADKAAGATAPAADQ